MKSIPQIRAVMTPFPYWVGSDRPVSEAVNLMADHEIRHLAVKTAGKLVSVLTARDIRIARNLNAGADRLSVGEICVRQAYVVELSEPLDRVLQGMAESDSDAALVVKDDKLAGIFTMTDACGRFGDLLRSLFPSGGDDAA